MLEEHRLLNNSGCSVASLHLSHVPEVGAGCELMSVMLSVSHPRCPCMSTGPTGLAGHRDSGWVLALGYLELLWALTGSWLSTLGIDGWMVSPNGNFLGDSQGGETPGESWCTEHLLSWERLWLRLMTSTNPHPHPPHAVPTSCCSLGCPTRTACVISLPCCCLSVSTASAACRVLVTSSTQGSLLCWAG